MPSIRRVNELFTPLPRCNNLIQRIFVAYFPNKLPAVKNGVIDGTRTRNSQDHNLELYH